MRTARAQAATASSSYTWGCGSTLSRTTRRSRTTAAGRSGTPPRSPQRPRSLQPRVPPSALAAHRVAARGRGGESLPPLAFSLWHVAGRVASRGGVGGVLSGGVRQGRAVATLPLTPVLPRAALRPARRLHLPQHFATSTGDHLEGADTPRCRALSDGAARASWELISRERAQRRFHPSGGLSARDQAKLSRGPNDPIQSEGSAREIPSCRCRKGWPNNFIQLEGRAWRARPSCREAPPRLPTYSAESCATPHARTHIPGAGEGEGPKILSGARVFSCRTLGLHSWGCGGACADSPQEAGISPSARLLLS